MPSAFPGGRFGAKACEVRGFEVKTKGIFAFAERYETVPAVGVRRPPIVRMLAPGEVNPNFETWEGPYSVLLIQRH